MEEARDPKSAVNLPDDAGEESGGASRHTDATSETTLSELEETQKSSEGRSSSTTGSGSSSSVAPSPDGAFDEQGGGRADGSDSGGPM
jgi:hypothetical protein